MSFPHRKDEERLLAALVAAGLDVEDWMPGLRDLAQHPATPPPGRGLPRPEGGDAAPLLHGGNRAAPKKRGTVLPHMQHALRIGRRLGWLTRRRAEDALHEMRIASLRLRRNGYIEEANELGRALLARLPEGCVRYGQLRSLGTNSSPTMADALARCKPSQPVRIAAHIGSSPGRVVGATLFALPPDDGDKRGAAPHFLLLVEVPDEDPRRIGTAVADLFGLTRAEVRVLGGLLQGQSAAQIADEAQTSIATVRSQIASVLTKTGTSSQLQLVLMLRHLRR